MDTHHVSTYGEVSGAWKSEGSRLTVLFIDDPARETPAVRWPDEVIPDFRSGHITFGPEQYPSLHEVRELLPEHAGLWDSIAADHAALLMEATTTGPAARQHADFFDLPLHLTDAERRPPRVDH